MMRNSGPCHRPALVRFDNQTCSNNDDFKKIQGHGIPVLPVFVDFLQRCLGNYAKIAVSPQGIPP